MKTDWLSHEAMKDIHPAKRQIIEDIIAQMEGKTLSQAAPVIADANRRLKEENLAFTDEENELLFAIMTESMSPEQKQQFNMMRQFVQKRFPS